VGRFGRIALRIGKSTSHNPATMSPKTTLTSDPRKKRIGSRMM
jgi:hypothetical protein